MTETAPAIGLFEAKTHFSKIVDDLLNGRSGAGPVMRRGKPAVCIVPDALYRQAFAGGSPGICYGLAKEKYRLARDIDAGNAEVLEFFRENREVWNGQAGGGAGTMGKRMLLST